MPDRINRQLGRDDEGNRDDAHRQQQDAERRSRYGYARDYSEPGRGYGSRDSGGSDSSSRALNERRQEHSSQAYGAYGEHGGGYGTDASYSNQGRHVGYSHQGGFQDVPSHRSPHADYGPYGAQGEYAPQPARYSKDRWPKSYTRSDERIREDVYERILHHGHIDARDVTVVVAQGVVTLQGTVPERHMKHDIENIADGCMGVKDIENQLRVDRGGGGEQRREEVPDRSGPAQSVSQAWGRGTGTGTGVEDHGNRTTGGAMGYTANSNTAAGVPPGTRK